METPEKSLSSQKPFEQLEENPEVRMRIAEMLVQGEHTTAIVDLIQEQYGRGFTTAIYKSIDSCPKAIRFVQKNRPDSTPAEIRNIWFNRHNRYARYFDNL